MTSILSRRSFLGVLAAAGGGMLLGPRFVLRRADAAPAPTAKKVFVHVFLRGGLDGLSAVVPFGEKEYYGLRRTTAIAPPKKDSAEAALALDDRFGLHPALAPLLPDYEAGRLAVVHAVGCRNGSRSHFDAQDAMESGVAPADRLPNTGWLARYLDGRPVEGDAPDADMFRAISITPVLPRTLRGHRKALAIESLGGFTVAGGAFLSEAIGGMYAAGGDDPLHSAGREAFAAVERLKELNPGRFAPENGAEYPRGRFGDQMKTVAQLVKADVGLEVAFVDAGGYDTHLNQGAGAGALAGRLAELGQAMHALALDLGDRMSDVVVATLTEFGRTAAENGTRGTDHGTASVAFVLGGPVKGGKVHGKWPGLAKEQLFEKRDLAVATDYRDLLGEILTAHLGAKNLPQVFPGHRPAPLGLL